MGSVLSVIIKNSKRQEKMVTIKEKMLSFIAFSIVFFSLSISMIVISFYVTNRLKQIEQEYTFVSILLMLNFLILFAKSIFESLNSLYFSKDLKILLRMPIKNRNIVNAKLINMIVSEYQMEFIMLAIPMIVFGIIMGVKWYFYLFVSLILLVLPVIPIVVSSVIIAIIMRLINCIKNKNKVMYIAIIASAFLVEIAFLGINNLSKIEVASFERSVLTANGIASSIADYSALIKNVLDILMNYNTSAGLINLLLFFAQSIGVYIIGLVVISLVYLKGAIGTTINGDRNESISNTLNINDFQPKGKRRTYLVKELKIMSRTPIFFVQCLIIPIIYPFSILMVCVMALIFSKCVGVDIVADFLDIINTSRGQAIFLGVGDVFFMMNFCSIIGISKDSNSAIMLKTIPIGLKKQFNLRTTIGKTINYFSVIMITIISYYTTKNLWNCLLVFLILVLMDGVGEKVKLLIDLQKPQIKWDNEYTMMKQHTNVMYVLFYTLLFLGLLFLISLVIKNVLPYLLVVLVLIFIENYFINLYVKNNKDKIFGKIY